MEPQVIIDQNKEVYNKICKQFAGTRKFLWDELKPLAKYIKDGDKVLDLACGTGRLNYLFQDKQVEYIGIDNSEGQVGVAKEAFPKQEFRVGEMTSLGFEDESFDVVFCVASLHHLPTKKLREKSFREMVRVVKPGGLVILLNWNLDTEWAKGKLESGKWRLGDTDRDFIIPWRASDGNVLGERYYYAFTVTELGDMFNNHNMEIIENSTGGYERERKDGRRGDNIVSVIKKPA